MEIDRINIRVLYGTKYGASFNWLEADMDGTENFFAEIFD
jgi:hypothetical protein